MVEREPPAEQEEADGAQRIEVAAPVERIARPLTRMALSYVAMPPEGDRNVAADMAAVMGPAIEAARV